MASAGRANGYTPPSAREVPELAQKLVSTGGGSDVGSAPSGARVCWPH